MFHMNKQKKKWTSILMSIVMMLGLLSANTITAYAAEPEFYAVFNTAAEGNKTANTLSFYYDTNKSSHTAATETVYANLPTEAKQKTDWGYDAIRSSVANVVIDGSAADYHGLKSTCSMFGDMTAANSISGCEYLDVSNVTDMSRTFSDFAKISTSITSVPDVSKWDTGKVESMASMFSKYAAESENFTAVPDVSKWDTGKVENMASMFSNYASGSKSITDVPDVSKWNTGKVKYINRMFNNYAAASTGKLQALDLSKWSISSLEKTSGMFQNYANNNTEGDPVVYAADWTSAKTLEIKNGADNMFTTSKLKNAGTLTVNTDQWAYANTGATGCFTIKTYTLSFDMQGHGTQVDPQTVAMGAKVERPDDPTESGYTFGGWFKEAACTNAWDFDTDTVNEDTTLYAKWKSNIVITANSAAKTYDGTPLTDAGFTYPEEELKEGDVLEATVEGTITDVGTAANKVKESSIKVTRDGIDVTDEYQFATPVDGTLEVTKRGVTLTSASATKVYDGTPLTASDVTVTGDGFVSGEGASYDVTGSQTEIGTSRNTFTYTLNEGTKADNYNITKVEGDLTVTPEGQYLIVCNEADNGTVTADKETAAEGDTVTLSVTPDDGYRLDALTAVDAGGGEIEITNKQFTMPAANVTVSATFKKAAAVKYTVTFDLDGKGDDFTREVASGSNAKRPKNPTYKGWTFKGWFADAARTIKWIFDGEAGADRFKITEDTTIYAKWEEKSPEPKPDPKPDPKPQYEEHNQLGSAGSSSTAPVKTGTWNDPVTDGTWSQGADGKWTYTTNAVFKNTWGYILNPYASDEANRYGWFRFDENGKMLTGWVEAGGKWYYLNEDSSRGCLGMCLINTTTPDGHKVDENGARVD